MSDQPTVYPAITYAIDAQDRLVSVDDAWEQFADENEGGQSLRPDSVMGQSLWSFIREESLRSIYRQLIATVREQNQTLTFDFRCDSPRFRRFMRMTMTSNDHQGVRFHSQTKEIRRRIEDVRAAAAFTGAKHIVRCSICNLYQTPDRRWVEVAEAVATHRLLNSDQRPRLLWSVCSACRQRLSSNSG